MVSLSLRRGSQRFVFGMLVLSMPCSLFAVLSGVMLLPATPANAQSFSRRIISKRCGHCGHAVSVRSRTGGHCPYCGVFWSYETSHKASRSQKKHRSAKKPSRNAKQTRSRKPTAQVRIVYPQLIQPQPVQRMEYTPQYVPAASTIAVPQYESTAEAIGRIRSQPYSALPAPSAQSTEGAEQGSLRILNQTSYTLYVHYVGQVTRTITIQAGQSSEVILPEGEYEVAGEVSNKNVRPFYGKHSYATNTRYTQTFYIVTR